MKRFIWIGLALGALISFTTAGPTVEESEIRFQIVNAGLTVQGSLTGLEADIRFDPVHPEQASIRASVPVNTIKTGLSFRDRHLQKPDYFNAEQNPVITLQSKTIRKTGRDTYEGLFDLGIKAIHRDVKMPFSVSPKNEFVGNLQINRLDFDVGKSSLVLANEVFISIRVKVAGGS
ncbi:hypothetical protein GCM10028803_30620 [Larkinella knui]|uniref:YceI family protein n=1 Tax=Larkinella knui TaxID=2025310 RepID=A0A3P1CXY3_9BACT|nr:YceI family protein [Larkinella knui]RRB18089.1 YceI family protein [Larkinella knui]